MCTALRMSLIWISVRNNTSLFPEYFQSDSLSERRKISLKPAWENCATWRRLADISKEFSPLLITLHFLPQSNMKICFELLVMQKKYSAENYTTASTGTLRLSHHQLALFLNVFWFKPTQKKTPGDIKSYCIRSLCHNHLSSFHSWFRPLCTNLKWLSCAKERFV